MGEGKPRELEVRVWLLQSLGPELHFSLATSEQAMLQMVVRLYLKSSYTVTFLVMYLLGKIPLYFILGCLGKLITMMQFITSASCPQFLPCNIDHQSMLMLPKQGRFTACMLDSAPCSIQFLNFTKAENMQTQMSRSVLSLEVYTAWA